MREEIKGGLSVLVVLGFSGLVLFWSICEFVGEEFGRLGECKDVAGELRQVTRDETGRPRKNYRVRGEKCAVWSGTHGSWISESTAQEIIDKTLGFK